MKPTTIKLENFASSQKLQEFISHLETIPAIATFVIAGDAILLEFEPQNSSIVYYTDVNAYLRNEPIIALGRDCEASRKLTGWDYEQLELKRIVNWGV
jgi:hypothetical protein